MILPEPVRGISATCPGHRAPRIAMGNLLALAFGMAPQQVGDGDDQFGAQHGHVPVRPC
jgi:hypothetical protein